MLRKAVMILSMVIVSLTAHAPAHAGSASLSQFSQQLLTAIEDGSREEISALLRTAPFPQNHAERLFLLLAAMKHDEDDFALARQLIREGIDVNEKIDYDSFPKKEKETAEISEQAAAPVAAQQPDDYEDVEKDVMDGATILILFSLADEIRLIRFMLEQGADVNVQTAGGYTPLSLATANFLYYYPSEKHREIILYLLEHGADPWKKIKLLPTMQTLDKFRGAPFTFVTLAEALNDEKINDVLLERGIVVVQTEAGRQLKALLN
jgi:ankyrin repeat protein